LWLGVGCGTADAPPSGDGVATQAVPTAARTGDQSMALTRPPSDESGIATAIAPLAALLPVPEVEIPEPVPVEYRIARQMLTIFAAPDPAAPVRGRIPMGEGFEVFELVDGPACGGKGWADIGSGGYVCVDRTRRGTKSSAVHLPVMRDKGLAPHFYAKVVDGDVAYRWASQAAYFAGKEPLDTLEKGHDYAFDYRKKARGEMLLIDDRRRVVPQAQVRRYLPSRFSGRDLEEEPLPAGQMLAWTVAWPETEVFASPARSEEPTSTLGYHEVVYLEPTPAKPGWYVLADGSGYVSDSSLGRFVPPHPLEGTGPAEIWIDVELDEQVLTVMRGESPVFATLVSSGFKAPTPRGIFRIYRKQAEGSMNSNPGDEDPYAVESVPFVQYFAGGYALHTAYWHNRFGRPLSHGCVNLSPRDAKYVFERTGPHLRAGWLEAWEHEAELGTSVRIRRGVRPIEDKRKPVEHFLLGG
jgi:hypothetical protein